ncbi:hypothetical protein GCM10023083_06620 [Streptomyces phyllanthi]
MSVAGWKDIWLDEGFARYAQWLWSEHEGEGTAQELADHVYASHPAGDRFWTVRPGDPGPENQFDIAVYDRGALAVQALRNEIGDEGAGLRNEIGDEGGGATGRRRLRSFTAGRAHAAEPHMSQPRAPHGARLSAWTPIRSPTTRLASSEANSDT